MVGIQTIRRRKKTDRRESTSNNKQTQTKKPKRFEIVHGSNQPNEPIHTKSGEPMCTTGANTEKRQRMVMRKRTRGNI